MSLTIPEVLLRLTVVWVLLATGIGVCRWRHLQPNLRYLVGGLVVFILPLEVLGLVLMLQQRNNLFVMPIYTVLEFGLLAVVYRFTLQSRAFARLLPWLVGGFTTYVVLDSALGAKLATFRPSQQVVQGSLILGLVGLYLRKLLRDLLVQRLSREPMFWVSVGLLIYYLGYLQIALFSNYMLRFSDQLNMHIWAVHSVLYMLLYSCYAVAFLLFPQADDAGKRGPASQ